MLKLVKSQFEIIALRAVPGLLNLWALLLLGDWLSSSQYGAYSIGLVAAGFASSIIFGPLQLAVVSQYAHLKAQGVVDSYESSFISLTIILSMASIFIGLIAAFSGFIRVEWILAAVSFGIYTNLQELLRARLQIIPYGIASLFQSICFVLLVYGISELNAPPSGAWYAYSLSYIAASGFSFAFLGFPRIHKPDMSTMSSTWSIGFGNVLSTASEQCLFLGTRYVISIFGNPNLLGVFSFCVDLAQRTIGFLVNTASFVFVPMAFRERAQGADRGFAYILLRGAAVSLGLSLLAFSTLIAIRKFGVVPGLSGESFDIVTFAIVSLAVFLNRLKKLVADPFAMAKRKPLSLATGYLLGALVALPLAIFAYRQDCSRLGEIAYPIGYLLAIFGTFISIRKRQSMRPIRD